MDFEKKPRHFDLWTKIDSTYRAASNNQMRPVSRFQEPAGPGVYGIRTIDDGTCIVKHGNPYECLHSPYHTFKN